MAMLRIIAGSDAVTLHDDTPDPPVELAPGTAVEVELPMQPNRAPFIPRKKRPVFIPEPKRPVVTFQVDDPAQVRAVPRPPSGGELTIELGTSGDLHVASLRRLAEHAERFGSDLTIVTKRRG